MSISAKAAGNLAETVGNPGEVDSQGIWTSMKGDRDKSKNEGTHVVPTDSNSSTNDDEVWVTAEDPLSECIKVSDERYDTRRGGKGRTIQLPHRSQ